MSKPKTSKLALTALAPYALAFAFAWAPGAAEALPTNNSGSAYITECRNAGVPIPPNWGGASSPWISAGVLTDPFISTTSTAHVYYWTSTNPSGVCIALPRVNSSGTVKLLGIICQGNTTNRACFWDNSGAGGLQFDIASLTTSVPLSSFNGGKALEGAQGGPCTNCHAGANAFNVQPGTALDLTTRGVQIKANGHVLPIVPASWYQNDLTNNINGSCSAGCHSATGYPGPLPRITSLLAIEGEGWCDAELANAWEKKTMPPGGNQTPDFLAHYTDLAIACNNTPPPANPQPSARQSPFRIKDQIALMWISTGG